jgi:hypothetical protein
VNGNVAANALTTRLESEAAMGDLGLIMETGVTFQTQLPPFATNEQVCVRGSVRVMAGDAAAHRDGRMLVNERSVLFDVAVGASLVDVG